MLKLNASVVSEIKELTALLNSLRAFKGGYGPTYADRAYDLLEKQLDAACKKLVEGSDA